MDNLFLCEYLGTPPRHSKFIDQVDRVFRKVIPWIRIGSYWRGQMASIESRMNLFHLANQVLLMQIEGDFVEVGCHAGESTVILKKILREKDSSRNLYAFDSFQGVPESVNADEGVYKKGDMSASLEKFNKHFEQVGLDKPITIPGWFVDTLESSLPGKIAFALIDADLYNSTLFALQNVYPRLSPGGICLMGVYWDPNTKVEMTTDPNYKSPGVKKACDEFLADKPEKVNILIAGNYTSAYFRKV
ncbi:MAG TPA: TylF/MycF/NovP-related O-methyltransferase [Ignavibacteriaceae bacterium]|jgi:O-methyltransferase|nr:TylF/MycF/NovP-related O-methyltransferase [Ignavibacteriaceae bacterium]